MPAAFILDHGCIHAIEIAAPCNCRCDSDRIAHLHALRLRVSYHGKTSNCSRETRRRVRWQRLHLERYGLAADLYVPTFAELGKWIREKRIRKWIILIEQIERRTGTGGVPSSRNDDLGFRFDRSDFKFPGARCSNCRLKRHDFVRPAVDGLQILRRLLQFLSSK